jgi:homoserine kinase
MTDRVQLKLPATSANLGPGFDAVALAFTLHLEITAMRADSFALRATGRNPDICGAVDRNLLLETYSATLRAQGREVVPLALEVCNGIPLGMGCGSSAAVRLAGVALAASFGNLGWNRDRVLAEASRLEGHPDNAAACWLGGFALAAWDDDQLQATSIAPPPEWKAMLVLPDQPLATTAARAVLPAAYDRCDVVANLQRAALLTAAFAQGRGDLVANAMRDRIHQPYRSAICPLLPLLLPLAGRDGILGVALSGAGPAVLLLIASDACVEEARTHVRERLGSSTPAEIVVCSLESGAAEWHQTTLESAQRDASHASFTVS